MRIAWTVVLFFGASVVAAPAHPRMAVQSSVAARQVMDGEGLFRTYCAACHGADARGQGPAASALKTAPSDLTAITARNGGTFPRDRLVRFIANGTPAVTAHGSRDMPVWGPNLTALSPTSDKSINERIEAIVAYIRSLQKVR